MAAIRFDQARLPSTDPQSSLYGKSTCISEYSRMEGLLAIPVLGPATTGPVIVRVHAPYGFREVNFEYAKEGSPPLMPAPADIKTGYSSEQETNDYIASSLIELPAPVVSGSGKLIFGARGTYLYIQNGEPRGTESNFGIDGHPFPTPVDFLGQIDPNYAPVGTQGSPGTWNIPTFDMKIFGTYNILRGR